MIALFENRENTKAFRFFTRDCTSNLTPGVLFFVVLAIVASNYTKEACCQTRPDTVSQSGKRTALNGMSLFFNLSMCT